MNLFKKYWKEIIIILLVSTVLVGGCSYNQKVSDYETKLDIKDEQLNDSVMVYKTKNGDLMFQKNTLETDVDNLEENLETLGIDRDKLKDQIGNLKNLNNRLSARVESLTKIILSDTVKDDDIVISDSTFNFEGETRWENKYILTTGTYNISGKYLVDNTVVKFSNVTFNQELDYKYTVDFTTTSYWKRENKLKFWKPKTLVTDVEFSDPNAKVVSIQSIEIKEPPKKFYEKNVFWGIVGGVVGFAIK